MLNCMISTYCLNLRKCSLKNNFVIIIFSVLFTVCIGILLFNTFFYVRHIPAFGEVLRVGFIVQTEYWYLYYDENGSLTCYGSIQGGYDVY